jgi:hypothetical protein
MTTSKKLSAKLKAWRRRKVLDGFPVETPFKSIDEVEAYFSQDRITCLRCGKGYKALAKHLRIHGWNEEQYKFFYGLPISRGLTSPATRELKISIAKKNYDSKKTFGGEDAVKEAREKSHKAGTLRRNTGYKSMMSLDNLKRDKIFSENDFWGILEKMKELDKTASLICDMDEFPAFTTYRDFARKNKLFRQAARDAHEALSFPMQAKSQILGKRFRDTIAKMRLDGKTNIEIAKETGVSLMTVSLNISHIKKPIVTTCPKGHEKINGRCKICNTENARKLRGNLPREVAAETMVSANCTFCGKEVSRSVIVATRRVIMCDDCKAKYFREYDANRRRKNP